MEELYMLPYPERIRLRPEVVFLSDGIEGVRVMLKTLMDIFFEEAVMGFCKRIEVRIFGDNSIEIISCDRGLYLDETVVDGKPSWSYVFCESSVTPFDKKDFSLYFNRSHNELYGINADDSLKFRIEYGVFFALSCAQCASEYMDVEVVRDGVKKNLRFKKGYNIGGMEKTPANEPSYTKIRFRPDSEVFTDINVLGTIIAEMLQTAAVTIRGLESSFSDERLGLKDTYYYENGIESLALDAVCNSIHTPLYVKELEATGSERNSRDYDARVRVALAFSESVSFRKYFHNFSTLKLGGDHIKSAESEILKTIQRCFGNDEKLSDILLDEINKKLILIVETNCSEYATKWLNAQKFYITNTMIRDMCIDLFDDFERYVTENKEKIRSVLSD